MPDYIPTGDFEFDEWQGRVVLKITANLTTWGIPASDLAVLKAKQTDWIDAFSGTRNKKDSSSTLIAAKNEARAIYEKEFRRFTAQWLSHNAKISNGDRENMGLTISDESRTPSPVPTTRPEAKIDFSFAMQHVIRFKDENSAGKAKPEGVHGCEIWAKIDTEAPKSTSELKFIATCTHTPYTAHFESADAGKTAWYRLRWVNTGASTAPGACFLAP